MGSRIISLILENDNMELHGALEPSSSARIGEDVGEVIGMGRLGVKIESSPESALQGADVVIDFSHVSATPGILAAAAGLKVPAVVGTTGFSRDQVEEIEKSAAEIPLVFAPNMSVGVNLLFKVLAEVAAVLGNDYDVEIVEAHHRLKKDAPSGTALKMAQIIADSLGRNLEEVGVYGRKGLIGR